MSAKIKEEKPERYGWSGAILAALTPLFVLIIIPAFIMFAGIEFGKAGPQLASELKSLIVMLIVIGLPAVVVTFAAHYFRKGSVPRVVLGVAEAVAVFLYIALLFYYLNLLTVFGLLSFNPDLGTIFLALMYAVILLGWGFVGEFFSKRRAYRATIGRPLEAKPMPIGIALDFSPRAGDARKGQRTAVIEAAVLVIVPILLLVLVPSIASSQVIPLPDNFASLFLIFSAMASVVLVIGLIAVPLAWLMGFYRPGTSTRALFSSAFAIALLAYIWFVLMGHGLSDWLAQQGIFFDYNFIVTLLLVVPLFRILVAVGELLEQRKPWKRSWGIDAPDRPINTVSAFLDFNPRTGSIAEAARAGRRAWLAWLVLPFFLFNLSSQTIATIAGVANRGPLSIVLDNISWSLFTIALVIVALSMVWGFYPKGSFGRLIFGAAKAVFIVLFVVAIFHGGSLGSEIYGTGFKVDLDPVVGLFVILAAMFFIVPFAELADDRRAWKKRFGRSLKKLSAPKQGAMTDFRLRYARFVEGARESRRGYMSYIVIPQLFIVIMRGALLSVNNVILNQAAANLTDLGTPVLLVGVAVVVVQFFRGMWGPGAFSRLAFGWVVAMLSVVWVYVFLSGLLNTSVTLQLPGTPINIDLSPYLNIVLIIFIVLSLLTGVRYTLEFLFNRARWAENRESLVVYE